MLDVLADHPDAALLHEGCKELGLQADTAKHLLAYLFTERALLRTGTAQDAASAQDMSPEPHVDELW